MQLSLSSLEIDNPPIERIKTESVTVLNNQQENSIPQIIGTEEIALFPKKTVFISSEGVPK
ncbi:hypothetical protein [cyanobacterium endosymbiont of Rhopalodia gibberula]|uniref:hypothetical protein n=1 Tax=cyanobacterium endosymbiont of Rhopalodia gibberula TaxID=1763363 RepID=UPI000E652030|nr:hypothetical protein [cyanobacterium endosymbiont of Rhopalodia gibberula]